jgi:hypothetical protein
MPQMNAKIKRTHERMYMMDIECQKQWDEFLKSLLSFKNDFNLRFSELEVAVSKSSECAGDALTNFKNEIDSRMGEIETTLDSLKGTIYCALELSSRVQLVPMLPFIANESD